MRLGWLLALAASVALLVGALVMHTAAERERRGDRDEGLGAVSALSANNLDGELERVAAVLQASPDGRPLAAIADQLGGDLNLCAIGATTECASAAPRAAPALEQEAVAAATGQRAPAFVTAEGDATDAVVVVAVAGPQRTLVAHIATRGLLAVDTTLIPNRPFHTPRLVDGTVAEVELGPSSRGDRRLFTVPVRTGFVAGDRFVVASAPSATPASAGQRWALTVSLLVGAAVFVASASALIAHHRRLSRHAATDDLTGLLTRREFERLGRTMLDGARREGVPAVAIFIDLNGFKSVNDEAGHHVGDIVLKAVAAHLSGLVRDSDVIARWGGDEFAMLLPGAGSVAAARRAGEIEAALEHVTTVAARRVSASVGAAVFPEHGGDLTALMRAADSAMYSAKRSGQVFGIATGV